MSKPLRHVLTVMAIVMFAVFSFAIAPRAARAAGTGAITVDGTVATRYDAYQLFSATVVDDADADQKVATDMTWANDAVRQAVLPVLHDAGLDGSASTAQEAAEWMNADGHMTTALAAELARAIVKAGAVSVPLNAGMAAELPCGYWLIAADDGAIAEGEAGTAPIMALVGGSAVTVKPKAATPKVAKHVLEDSTAAVPALRGTDTAPALTIARASFAVSSVVMCPSAFIHSAASCAVDAEPSSPASWSTGRTAWRAASFAHVMSVATFWSASASSITVAEKS